MQVSKLRFFAVLSAMLTAWLLPGAVVELEQYRFQGDSTLPYSTSMVDIASDAVIALKNLPGKIAPGMAVKGRLYCPATAASVDFTAQLTADKSLVLKAGLLQKIRRAIPAEQQLYPVRVDLEFASQTSCLITLILLDRSRPGAILPSSIKSVNGKNYFYYGNKRKKRLGSRISWIANNKFMGKTNRQFAQVGVHSNKIACNPYLFMQEKDGQIVLDEKTFLKHLERQFLMCIAEDPDCTIILNWMLLMPPSAQKLFPEEMIKLDTGTPYIANPAGKCLQPSYASEWWRKTAGQMLQNILTTLKNSPFADRLTGVWFTHANSGEWNHWGYREQAIVDFSLPMQRAFGKWLKNKYITKENLQQAWGRSNVDFDSTDLVPTREQRLIGSGPFRLGGTAVQSSVDYYEFFQEYTVRTIEYFCKIVKEVSEGKMLAGSYYGYYWAHYCAMPYHAQDSGHYGVKYVNSSPYIDMVGGPASYWKRTTNMLLHGISQSLALHGKMWEAESDTRTHNSRGRKQYGITNNLSETLAVLRRDFTIMRSGNSVTYFYDFGADWFCDSEIMSLFGQLNRLDDFMLNRPERFPRQLAVIVSEEVIPHLTSRNDDYQALRLFQKNMFFDLYRLGVPFDMYLESDLDKLDPDKYKAFIFINSYFVSDRTMELVKTRIMKNQRQIIFYYAPGVIGKDNNLDLERSYKFTGIKLKALPKEFKDSPVSLKSNSAIKTADPAPGPHFAIDDRKAKVFAVYDDGTPAAAILHKKDHSAIVICHPAPDHLFMRDYLRRMGIKSYQESGSALCYFTGDLMTIYSDEGGIFTLCPPSGAEIFAELFRQRAFPAAKKFKTSLPAGGPASNTFFFGSQYDWFKYLEADEVMTK